MEKQSIDILSVARFNIHFSSHMFSHLPRKFAFCYFRSEAYLMFICSVAKYFGKLSRLLSISLFVEA